MNIMMKDYKEFARQQEIDYLERAVKNDTRDASINALKVVGSTALTSAGVIGACLLLPDVIKTYGSDEAITFAAVTLLRFKESGVAISAIGAFAGLFGTITGGVELKEDIASLHDNIKKLKLKRDEKIED
jgi:hypothetical protein